jgi:hypothetical protein
VQVHNATSIVSLYDSHRIDGFGTQEIFPPSYFFTFNTVGVYHYICEPHVVCCDMRGRITVVEGTEEFQDAPVTEGGEGGASVPSSPGSGDSGSFLDNFEPAADVNSGNPTTRRTTSTPTPATASATPAPSSASGSAPDETGAEDRPADAAKSLTFAQWLPFIAFVASMGGCCWGVISRAQAATGGRQARSRSRWARAATEVSESIRSPKFSVDW